MVPVDLPLQIIKRRYSVSYIGEERSGKTIQIYQILSVIIYIINNVVDIVLCCYRLSGETGGCQNGQVVFGGGESYGFG